MKKKILFLVQLPPPTHGASLMNKTIIDNKKVNLVFKIDVLPIQLANSMKDIGDFSIAKVFNAFKSYFKLIKKLIKNKYDLIYFTISPLGFAFYKDLILVIILKIFNKKIVYHIHGKGILGKTLKSKFQKLLYKFVFKNTDVIILANILHKDIENVFYGKPKILPNGIPKKNLNKVNTKKDKITFIYLSNLIISKGILVFVEALKELSVKSSNFKALIVGNSADVSVNELKTMINKYGLSDIVKVIGPAYGEDKYKKLTESNVFVLPTFYKNECFPLTIIEAFQSNLAVISTKNGAISAMVKENVNGFLVKINDVKSLASKMLYCIENPELVSKMAYNNGNEYEKKYTEKIFINNFIEIINSI